MIKNIRDLKLSLDSLSKEITRAKTDRINKKEILASAVSIVDAYFRSTRGFLANTTISPDAIEKCDTVMRELLELTHKRSNKSSYSYKIKLLKNSLNDIEKQSLLQVSNNSQGDIDKVDQLIINTLEKMVPSASLSYKQALQDISTDNRISWRGPATDLREALRETLDYLAPDKEVTSQPNFKLEKDQNHPTMKQKVRFILRKRGLSSSSTQTSEHATQAVDEAVSSFVRSVYSRSSVSTHTPTDKNEVLRVRNFVRTSLCELLEIHI